MIEVVLVLNQMTVTKNKLDLTQKFVDKLAASGTKQRYADKRVPGLLLKVHPTGRKTYSIWWKGSDGKRREQLIGDSAFINLATARQEAQSHLSEARLGVDLAQRKRANRLSDEKALSLHQNTFQDAFNGWKASAHWAGMRQTTRDGYEISFSKHILPLLGTLRASEIGRREISDVLDHIRNSASDSVVRAAKTALSSFGNFLVEKEYWEINIVKSVSHKAKKTVRSRMLSDNELRDFWNWLNSNSALSHQVRDMLKLLYFLPARIGEIACLRDEWINEDERTLIVPGKFMKQGRDFEFPLVNSAWDILQNRRTNGETSNGFFFPSFGDPQTSMDGKRATRACGRFARKQKWDSFGPHDMRRTFATRMAKERASLEMIERCLSHKVGGGRAISHYNHHEYREEKREVLQMWEGIVLELIGTNPVEQD